MGTWWSIVVRIATVSLPQPSPPCHTWDSERILAKCSLQKYNMSRNSLVMKQQLVATDLSRSDFKSNSLELLSCDGSNWDRPRRVQLVRNPNHQGGRTCSWLRQKESRVWWTSNRPRIQQHQITVPGEQATTLSMHMMTPHSTYFTNCSFHFTSFLVLGNATSNIPRAWLDLLRCSVLQGKGLTNAAPSQSVWSRRSLQPSSNYLLSSRPEFIQLELGYSTKVGFLSYELWPSAVTSMTCTGCVKTCLLLTGW